MRAFQFHDPLWLFCLALPILVLWLRGRRQVSVLLVPFAAAWHRPSLKTLSRWPNSLALLGLVLLVTALARPQKVQNRQETNVEGYDIILAIDLSGSMLAEDYHDSNGRINRLQAVTPVIRAFIQDRLNDRIGIVVFAGRAYTMAPLTFDHDWLARQVERLRPNMLEDGTAIGDGLGVALTRLDQSKHRENGKRKGAFIILLTDGANNAGSLQPLQAAAIAAARGIPVYTIGAGRSGIVPVPIFDQQGNRVATRPMVSDLDQETLRKIAEKTHGRYFRAANSDTIQEAFSSIDKTRKIEFQSQSYLLTSELFYWPAIPGLAALLIGALLARANHEGRAA